MFDWQDKVCGKCYHSVAYKGSLTFAEPTKTLDSSLRRHTALTKRIRQSLGTENYSQIMKDIEVLSLEKYIDEMSGAVVEGLGRCKTEKDVWSGVEVCITRVQRLKSTYLSCIYALRLFLLCTADSLPLLRPL